MKVPQEGTCCACCCNNAALITCSVISTWMNVALDFTVSMAIFWQCRFRAQPLPPTSIATTHPSCITHPDVSLLVSEACFLNLYLQLNLSGTFVYSIKGLINVDCISAKQCFYLYGYFNPKSYKYIYFCKLEFFYLTLCPTNLKPRGNGQLRLNERKRRKILFLGQQAF